jgi:hypothetical protein
MDSSTPRPPLRVVGANQVIATRRDTPFVPVSWVAKVMGAEARCLWSAWFRSHNKDFESEATASDWSDWVANHNELVFREAEWLRRAGWLVTAEGLNKMRLEGQTGIIVSAQPDLIAVKDNIVRIEDCKTGQPRVAHRYQVMIYMAIVPLVRHEFSGFEIEGHLLYGDGAHKEISTADLDDVFRKDLFSVVRTLGGDEVPPRAPSLNECSFCPIAPNLCTDRVTNTDPVRVEHDLF